MFGLLYLLYYLELYNFWSFILRLPFSEDDDDDDEVSLLFESGVITLDLYVWSVDI